MSPDNIIEVVKAYRDGRTIQRRGVCKSFSVWTDDLYPVWNFANYEYRIKPDPHFRPFNSAEEAYEAIKKHGWVGLHPGTIRDDEHIVKNVILFADDTPFGILED